MPASRKISYAQIEKLLSWMETHPLLARGANAGIGLAKHATSGLWEELASRLNAMDDGVSKTPKDWRQYWNDLKCKVKRKWSTIQQYGNGSDGGPPWDGVLAPTEERILTVMGLQKFGGHRNVTAEVDMASENDTKPEFVRADIKQEFVQEPFALMSPLLPTQSSEESIFAEREAEKSSQENKIRAPPKRKHVEMKMDPNANLRPVRKAKLGPLQWAMHSEKRRLTVEERRMAVEERRMAVEERRLAVEERRLALEERRAEEDRTWRRDLITAITRISDAMSSPPVFN